VYRKNTFCSPVLDETPHVTCLQRYVYDFGTQVCLRPGQKIFPLTENCVVEGNSGANVQEFVRTEQNK
jgi:hypothetical protein